VLSRFGRLDVAYKLLFQKSWPSWLYAVTQGATTIWERWDGWTHDDGSGRRSGFQDPAMNSFNHYAYGSIGDWLYAIVAGIEIDPQKPAFEHVIIHPQPEFAATAEHLTSAKATYHSIRGKIASEWKIEAEAFSLRVVIPANCTATVYVPAVRQADVTEQGGMQGVTFLRMEAGCAVYEVESGEYQFSSKT
jgi:alpha-L-rhamnosidase